MPVLNCIRFGYLVTGLSCTVGHNVFARNFVPIPARLLQCVPGAVEMKATLRVDARLHWLALGASVGLVL